MKRVTTSLCLAAAMAWSATVEAQGTQTTQPRGGGQTNTTTQTQTQTRDTTTQPRANTTTVSYIGCVESSGPNAFALTVSELPAAGVTASATDANTSTQTATGTTGAAARPATGAMATNVTVGQRVQLIGSGRTNIGSHAGHKVEVTGTLVPQGAAQGRTTGQPAAEMRLNVNNVRMISAMCDANTTTSSPQTRPRSQAPDSTTQPAGTAGPTGTTTMPEPAPQQQRQP